jgi:predicted nicotinamide N-methyase
MGCTKKAASSDNKPSTDGKTENRPRNHLITDATEPFDFVFTRYGVSTTITVHQRPDEHVWPGGALWDLGVLLAQVLVKLTRGANLEATTKKSTAVPTRLMQAIPDFSWKDMRVLELGCGVGLTGLVAAALGAKVTLLTDLQDVVETVVKNNVDFNTLPGPNKVCGYRTTRNGGRVVAMPLCWGNIEDEDNVVTAIERLTTKPTKRKQPKKGGTISNREGIPDLILIGDVAYQHKPGALSHFDSLLSTLLKFMDDKTLVLFGTRMRMPASADLLEMLRQHMEELVTPPIEAHELDFSFSENQLGRKHNITIHVLKLRSPPS